MIRYKKRIISFATLLAIIFCVSGFFKLLNLPSFQKNVFALLSKTGPRFEFSSPEGHIKLKFLTSRIEVKDLNFTNPKTSQTFHAKDIEINYSLLNLLRGKFQINKLVVNGFDAFIPRPVGEKEKGKKLSIKKLFVLENVIIKDGTINDAKFNFGGDSSLVTDTLALEFKPRLSGDVTLDIKLQGVNFKSPDNNISIGSLNIKGKTRLNDWFDYAPYVNSIKGQLQINEINLNGTEVASLSAKTEIKDQLFKLSDFDISKDGKKLNGTFELDFASETYKADIKIPEPIPFPTLGEENPVIDTSGNIFGEVFAEGKGFSFKTTSGKAAINLTHEKANLPPVMLESSVTWKNGVFTLGDTSVVINDGVIRVSGLVNVPSEKMDLKCIGENISLVAVFGRFGDPHFHPIFGTAANANATITGWGKSIHVVGEADTSGVSGYYQITTEHAHAKVEATYNELNLIGDISQDGKVTGDINLKIKYGVKVGHEPRPKYLHIEANAKNHDMAKSFEAYKLTGIGNGTFLLDGPQHSYTGKLYGKVIDGVFLGIPFQSVSANTQMAYLKMKFTDGEIIIPNMEAINFSSPIQFDFEESGLHAYGKPLDNLAFDVKLISKSESWTISNLKYQDMLIKGTYAPKGSSDLSITGNINADKLQVFKEYLREADGPLDVNLKFYGPTQNPSLNGKIKFSDNTIYLRGLNQRMEKVNGEIIFDGHTMKTPSLSGIVESGDFLIKGAIQHENLSLSRFDLSLVAHNLRYTTPDRSFRSEYDAKLNWEGSRASSELKGDISILDARYTKDFDILESLGTTKTEKKAIELPLENSISLDVRVQNTGDLSIRNNVADVWLKADFTAKGKLARPQISGLIETQEGKLHYLGCDFVITKGFIEFRDPYTNPYLEITGEHEVTNITDLVITALLHGRLENLQLDLSATKSLEKRDIVSLLLFGVTEQEAKDSQMFGSSLVASQISTIVQRPLTKVTHLDTFRIESGSTDSTLSSTSQSGKTSAQVSRMYIGKQLSDRLNVEFITDINTADAQQTLRTDYLITDFLVLKGERASGQNYKLNLSLRFRER